MLYRCNNCEFETDEVTDLRDIDDFWVRIESGDIMPEGQCPKCGAFVHRYNEEFLEKMAATDLLSAIEKLICYVEADADDEIETSDYAEALAAIKKAKGEQ